MNWLFPSFLAAGALIGLPVLLHFLRNKPKEEVRFPTLRFLGPSAIRDTRSHRLRRWLTLLLRCLIIGLVAAAFARPFWIGHQEKRRHAMVVAVDNSMSMRADGRWERAMGWASAQISDLGTGDRVGVLVMHPAPSWIVPPDSEPGVALATLGALKPGYETTRYGEALTFAANALASDPAGERTLVWMADEQAVGWEDGSLSRTLPPGVRFRAFEAQPTPATQIAITELAWLAGNRTPALQATIRSFSSTVLNRDLVVRDGTTVLATRPTEVRPGTEQVLIEIPALPEGAQALSVSLSEHDALPDDDAAWILCERKTGRKVLLDAPGSDQGGSLRGDDFVGHALRATHALSEQTVGALPDSDWPDDAIVVLQGRSVFSNPTSRARLDRFVEKGGALCLFVDGSPEALEWLKGQGVVAAKRKVGDASENGAKTVLHLRDWDPEHPILQAFQGQSLLPLLEAGFRGGTNLESDALIPIAAWPDGATAIAEWTEGGRRILLVGFAPDRNATDLVAQTAFVPLLHQSVLWLGELRSAKRDWRVGDLVELPESSGLWRAIEGPVKTEPQKVNGFIRASEPGIFEFEGSGGKRQFAINLTREESDLTPMDKPQLLAALESQVPESERAAAPVVTPNIASARAAETQQQTWWWLLAGVGILLLAELGLANRTTL